MEGGPFVGVCQMYAAYKAFNFKTYFLGEFA